MGRGPEDTSHEHDQIAFLLSSPCFKIQLVYATSGTTDVRGLLLGFPNIVVKKILERRHQRALLYYQNLVFI